MSSLPAVRLRSVALAAALAGSALVVACSQGTGQVSCELTPPAANGACTNSPSATGEASAEQVLDSGVIVETNLTYRSDAGVALQGDLYLPPGGPSSNAGVAVLIHGGGWSDCGRRRDAVASFAEQTARELGIGVFNIDYRLTEEGGGYPNNLEDATCATEWIGAHAATYHLNGQRLALIGESAGGLLALDVALGTRRADLDPRCGAMPPVTAVITYSAPTDLPALAASGSALVGATNDYAGPCNQAVPQCDVSKACDRCLDASPAAHACASLTTTRFLVVQAPSAYDPLLPYAQADELAGALSLVGAAGHLIVPTGAQLEAQGCAANDTAHPAHGMLTGCLPDATHDSVMPDLRAVIGP